MSHAVTAKPPYPPNFTARWAAVRDGATVAAGAFDNGAAKRGLTRGLILVMD
jgi:hypothetical protein